MQHNDILLLQIFCTIDDFCSKYNLLLNCSNSLADGKKHRNRASQMHLSEIMTIIVLFHLSRYRDFKHFYLLEIMSAMRPAFPHSVSYNRMVELMQQAIVPLALLLKLELCGKATGISFLDSTHISVCHTKRIHQNKVFKGLAERGKTTIGWFYGFKLHLIINDKGEILSFCITTGNTDDRNLDVINKLTKDIFGKIYADKGYISKDLFEILFDDEKQLITKLKKNMKGKIMELFDRVMLRQRSLIETVNDELKNICQISHTRHRSPMNWLANLISGLTAYMFLPKKPSLNFIRDNSDANLVLV